MTGVFVIFHMNFSANIQKTVPTKNRKRLNFWRKKTRWSSKHPKAGLNYRSDIFFPLRSYTYGYTTGKTAHLSLFLNRFKQWDSPQGQRRRQPYPTATLQERRKLNALTLLLPLLLDGNLGLRRPDSMSSTKWAEFWDLSKIKYLLWVSLFSRYV